MRWTGSSRRIPGAKIGRASGLALAGALSVSALIGGAGPAAAQDSDPWPSRAIRVVVPFAPGGVTDTVARLSAEWLRAKLGQPAVVENRPGANGLIAVEGVMRGASDGYSLLTASASQMVMLPALKQLTFDPTTSFAPISIVASNPMVLAVSAKLGVKTLDDFLKLVRGKPGKLDYSIAGIGSSTHLGDGAPPVARGRRHAGRALSRRRARYAGPAIG